MDTQGRSATQGGALSRREVLVTMAGAGIAGGYLLGGRSLLASAVGPARESPGEWPEVRAAFVRPEGKYWLGWPGTAWDVDGFTEKSRKLVDGFARDLKVRMTWAPTPLYDDAAVDKFIAGVKAEKPQGVLIFPLHMQSWARVRKIAEAALPTVIFAPLGVCFTGHIHEVSKRPGVYLASCTDFGLNPVRFGLKMIRVNHDVRRTRIAVLRGKETSDKVLEPFGLKLRRLPRSRFVDALKTIEVTPEVLAVAEDYKRSAARVVEPTQEDLINAAKNYFASLKIMEQEHCQGITMDCLGLVRERQIPCPPCLAWSKLLDVGVSATCEADIKAVMSHELCLKLLDKPGFMQDPVPNTVENTFIGAHCVCPTRLNGFDQPREKFVLRSHSESDLGVAVQVIWPVGAEVTIMQFLNPGKMILGEGKVLRNLDTPPAGGCRTSVELAIDAPADTRDTKGFHQLFIMGKHMRDFQAYGQMFGIATEHI